MLYVGRENTTRPRFGDTSHHNVTLTQRTMMENNKKTNIIKKPNFKQILMMLTELRTLKGDGNCFVPFGMEDIEKQIDSLKLYNGNK